MIILMVTQTHVNYIHRVIALLPCYHIEGLTLDSNEIYVWSVSMDFVGILQAKQHINTL